MVNSIMFAIVYIIIGIMIGTVAAVFATKENTGEDIPEKEEQTCSNCRHLAVPLHRVPCNTCCMSGTNNWERNNG